MTLPYLRDLGELIDVKSGGTFLSWTGGGAADSATFTFSSVDREAFLFGGSLPQSADIGVLYTATLASGKTLSIQFDLQDSADNTNFSDFATAAAAVVATGPSGGGLVTGVARMPRPSSAGALAGIPGVDLRGARRYVRLLAIPHLSATGTDTAIIGHVAVFGGFDLLPAAQS